tara:strand:+ start:33184 stop:33861 length:678 start_codon:yes stop_codon:yes gene_type:complete
MFTGIIEATGTVKSLQKAEGDYRLVIASGSLDYSDIVLGDSIAVSGVCLTVTELEGDTFSADVSNETMQCTNLAELRAGALVNLELALKPESRMGGHIVSGHVDGLATLKSRLKDDGSLLLTFTAPDELAHYVARKGSVCIDGISLTVNDVDGVHFSVNIIPHTALETTIQSYQVGRKVNLEVDLISRYLERLLQKNKPGDLNAMDSINKEGLSLELLRTSGFIK